MPDQWRCPPWPYERMVKMNIHIPPMPPDVEPLPVPVPSDLDAAYGIAVAAVVFLSLCVGFLLGLMVRL